VVTISCSHSKTAALHWTEGMLCLPNFTYEERCVQFKGYTLHIIWDWR